MPLLKLNSLGTQNINFDLEPCDLSANILTFGTNYKLLNGKIRATNMSYTLATPSANFNAGLIMSVLGEGGNFYMLLGQNSPSGTQVAWVFNGSTWTDISQVGAYIGIGVGDELLWTGCLLGNIPIVNNVQDYPAYWSPQQSAQKLQALNFGSSVILPIINYIGAGTTTVTGTVASTYGYSIGDTITISGATGTQQAKLNGVWTISSLPTGTTFTFVVISVVAAGTLTTGLGSATKSGMTWKAKGLSAKVVRSHKNFLFAIQKAI